MEPKRGRNVTRTSSDSGIKSKNAEGSGKSIVVTFDLTVPEEREASEAAKIYTELYGHGARKTLIVGFLKYMHDIYMATGKMISPVEAMSTQFLGQREQGAIGTNMPNVPHVDISDFVTSGGVGVSGEESAKAFKDSTRAFLDDDDDLWDD